MTKEEIVKAMRTHQADTLASHVAGGVKRENL